MQYIISEGYRDCVLLAGKSMFSYFEENGLVWSFEDRVKLYESFELYKLYDHEFIGYVAFRERNRQISLADIQILEEHRNKGFGTEVLKFAKRMAMTKGYNSILLKSFKKSPALNLYLRNGFKIIGSEEFVYLLSAQTSSDNQTDDF